MFEITNADVDATLLTVKVVEVALVEVEFPVMFKLPLTVEEAVEMKPPKVARSVTFKVDESVAAPEIAKVPSPVMLPLVSKLPLALVVALPPTHSEVATENKVVEALPKIFNPVKVLVV